jgi:hypothetical protein
MEGNSSQEGENVHLIDGKDLESLVIVTKKGEETVANNSEDEGNEDAPITVHYVTEDVDDAESGEEFIKVDSEDEEVAELAQWTRKFINSLPNSSFAIVESCADTNKAARHLPYKDSSGKVDLSHLRNALARMNQIKSVCGGSDSDLRAKAKAKLSPLAKKHFPNSKFMSEEDPDHEDNSNSNQEGDGMTEPENTDVKAELSEALEGLATKDELAEATKQLEAKRQELVTEIEGIKALKVAELAERVFTKEVEIGIVKEDTKDDRVKTLVEMGEPTMNALMTSYAAIPKLEPAKTGEGGEPNPKAANLSNQDDKLTPEKEDEVCQELRNKYFGHKDARQEVRAVGIDPDSNTMRYIAVEKIGE